MIFSKLNITEEQKAVLLDTINKKMATNPLKIRVDFTLTCTSFEGVDVIKEALLRAKHAVNTDGWNVEFKMIAPPNYMCQVITFRKGEGEQKLIHALKIIKEFMKSRGGHFRQKSEPTVIGANKEMDTDDLLEKFKQEQEKDHEEVESGEEDNREDMGDVNVDDDGAHVELNDSDEERKE